MQIVIIEYLIGFLLSPNFLNKGHKIVFEAKKIAQKTQYEKTSKKLNKFSIFKYGFLKIIIQKKL
jgi:hypothetical protein